MPIRIASVSFINSRPLIHGLDADPDVELSLAVPSALIAALATGQVDVALLPTIDYQSLPGLRMIPEAGGIGCDGPTLTVRLFSRVPIDRVRRVACDPDSHTSVALAKILFTRHFRADPAFVGLDDADDGETARLLIGDKVICEPPAGFEYQADLGEAWKRMTGLPFVFAIWTARPGVELGDLPLKLATARERGLAAASELVERFAVPRGWPADVALAYLTRILRYDVGPRQLEAIRLFHRYAGELGLLKGPVRALTV